MPRNPSSQKQDFIPPSELKSFIFYMSVSKQIQRSSLGSETVPLLAHSTLAESQQKRGKEVVADVDSLNLIPCSITVENQRRAVRLFNRQATKDKLFFLYQTAGLTDQAEKLKRCCRKFGSLICPSNHLANFFPTERCRLPLCPDCADFRAKRAFQRLFPRLDNFARVHKNDRLCLITLTLKNSSENLLKIHRFFKESFRKLRQRKNWKSKIRGGIASFELTIDKEGRWHYHAHILAFRSSAERYEQADLSDDWRGSTGGRGYIVDIRQVRDLKDGFRETLKYSFKPLDVEKNLFDTGKIKQFYELSLHSRLAESFGGLYGLETPENDDSEAASDALEVGSPCPKCKKPLEFIFHTRQELESILLGQNLLFQPMVC